MPNELKKSLLDSVFLPMKKSLLLISNLPSSSVSRSLKKKKRGLACNH